MYICMYRKYLTLSNLQCFLCHNIKSRPTKPKYPHSLCVEVLPFYLLKIPPTMKNNLQILM